MRFISIATVCFLAASSNVFAVPLGQEAETYVSRRASTSSLSSTAGDSEALSLGKVATGLGIASAATPIVKGIFDSVFGGNSTASRRDLEELERLLKRDDLGSLLLSRQNSTADQSGSLNILGIGEDIISAIGSLLSGGSNNQQRDLVTHVARRGAAPKVSSTTSESSSGSTLENVANGFSIASAAANIFHDIFGGSGNSTKRDELMTVLQARNFTTAASADGSGAIDIGSIIQTVLSLLPIKRELADAADSESGALKVPNLEQIANGFSIASSGANILHTIFGGSSDSTQTRDVIEQLLRRGTDPTDASGAVALGSVFKTLGNIGSIALNGGSILGDLFGGSASNSTQARELLELLARHSEARRDMMLTA